MTVLGLTAAVVDVGSPACAWPRPGNSDSMACSEADVVALFEAMYTRLCHAVARMLRGDHSAAEQIVMDAFEILYARRDRVRPDTAASYLWAVTINEARTAATRRTREAGLIDLAARRGSLPSDHIAAAATGPEGAAEFAHIRALVDALPPNQRIAVVLHYYCDWADNDIATAMKCRPVTVRSWLRRARTALGKQLTRIGEGK